MNRQLTARGLEPLKAVPGERKTGPSAVDHGPLVNVGKFRDLTDAQIAQSVLDFRRNTLIPGG